MIGLSVWVSGRQQPRAADQFSQALQSFKIIRPLNLGTSALDVLAFVCLAASFSN